MTPATVSQLNQKEDIVQSKLELAISTQVTIRSHLTTSTCKL